MTRQDIIKRTIHAINKLPKDKASEIAEFAVFITKKYEEQLLTNGIEQLVSESKAFSFLNEEEVLYSLSDLKEKYNE